MQAKEEPSHQSSGGPPLSIIDCPAIGSQPPPSCSTAEAILLRTDVLSLQRNNRNLEHQVDDLKNQLSQVTAELQEVKRRYTRDISEMEKDLSLKEEVLEEAVAELDTAKERIALLEKENAMLQKRKESRLELSELVLHIMDHKSTPLNGSLLRDFSESEAKEESSESPAFLLDALRSKLAFWKKNECDEMKVAQADV